MSIEKPWAHQQEAFDFAAPEPEAKATAVEKTAPPGTVSRNVVQIEAGDRIRESKNPSGGTAANGEDEYVDRIVEISRSTPDGDWSIKVTGENFPRHYDRDAELYLAQN